MTNDNAKPGGVAVRPPAHQPSWKQKLCPFLSLASLSAQSSRLMTPSSAPQAGPGATACQGGACMFFIPEMGPQGPNGDGVCCLTLLPIAVNQQTALLGGVANAVGEHLGLVKPVEAAEAASTPAPRAEV